MLFSKWMLKTKQKKLIRETLFILIVKVWQCVMDYLFYIEAVRGNVENMYVNCKNMEMKALMLEMNNRLINIRATISYKIGCFLKLDVSVKHNHC